MMGLELAGLSKSFGARTLWSDLSEKVPAGQMLALTGVSGSGKSTLLNCVGTLDTPDRGEVLLNGRSLLNLRSGERRRLLRDSVGFLFQNYALIDNESVSRNLAIATGAVWPWSRRDYAETLGRVGLEGRDAEVIYRLSGGEQQRVAMARLLLKRPALVLADEPTGALDDGNAGAILSLLRGMADRGATVVIATHSEVVVSACDLSLHLGTSSARVGS